jgi:metal-responsive CopG/Arc/MetJ family transcriptional regulator
MNVARSHKRAKGMTQTTIAIPADLLAQLDEIAQHQLRSRNSLIHWMLSEQIKASTGDSPAKAKKRKPAG